MRHINKGIRIKQFSAMYYQSWLAQTMVAAVEIATAEIGESRAISYVQFLRVGRIILVPQH